MASGHPRGRPGPMPLEPNPIVARLRAYDPGHDLPSLRLRHGPALAELGSNENPYGPSPRVLQALRALAAEEVYRYPDPQGLGLRRALAARDIGTLEIKKRGADVDPAQLRKRLKLQGSKHATLFLTRVAGKHTALLTERCTGA